MRVVDTSQTDLTRFVIPVGTPRRQLPQIPKLVVAEVFDIVGPGFVAEPTPPNSRPANDPNLAGRID